MNNRNSSNSTELVILFEKALREGELQENYKSIRVNYSEYVSPKEMETIQKQYESVGWDRAIVYRIEDGYGLTLKR